MATTIRRTKEKGQRTPRSLDAYQNGDGVRGSSFCGCGAIFRNKRWQCDESLEIRQGGQLTVCPACRRIADRNPAGVLTLKGGFLSAHKTEIDNLIKNTTLGAFAKNPLCRIMDVITGKDEVTITTTDAKLAEKIGRELFKSHSGELHFIWSRAENPVRVAWSR